MTKIKLCGLTRACDIEYANELNPDYIGFVFAEKSKRYISPENANILRKRLSKTIVAVGVFVDGDMEFIVDLVHQHIIDAVQLHGNESENYIKALRKIIECPIIKAFCIQSKDDIVKANNSLANIVLLDSGGGTGEIFDWTLLKEIKRPYFLAGGLTPANVGECIQTLQPFGVDASSSLEIEGVKDKQKMTEFVNAVRKIY